MIIKNRWIIKTTKSPTLKETPAVGAPAQKLALFLSLMNSAAHWSTSSEMLFSFLVPPLSLKEEIRKTAFSECRSCFKTSAFIISLRTTFEYVFDLRINNVTIKIKTKSIYENT